MAKLRKLRMQTRRLSGIRLIRLAALFAAVLLLCGGFARAAYAEETAEETVYDISDFIAWMLERDDLTDEMTADLENAQEMLEGYVESGEILLDDETDASSLTNLKNAVAILQTIDELRQSDDNYNGSIYTDTPTLYTNFTFMVGSAYTANVSATSYSHVSSYSTFSYNENLAWGYTDPTAGWYTKEKALFDECRDELGYSAPITSSQLSEIKSLASEKSYTIGHYTNLFYSVYQVMGVGYCTYSNSYSNKTASSNASSVTKNTANGYAAYTIDEFEGYFYEYYISAMGESGECGEDVTWSYDDDTKTLSINGNGAMTDYEAGTAPWAYLEDRITSVQISSGVTNVGAYAFYKLTGISSVVLPDGLTSVGNYAFYGCTALTSIEEEDSVSEIGSYAFYNCSALASAAILDAASSVGSYAFYKCIALETLTLPQTLTSIDAYAFAYCTGLETAVLPESLETLGNYAFRYCSGLENVTISGDIASVGTYPFYSCSALEQITFADGVTAVPAYLFGYASGSFAVSFSDTVSSIGMYAFYNTGIEKLSIPSTVTYLDGCAFASCKSLVSVSISSAGMTSSTNIFQNCTALTEIAFTEGASVSFGNYAFYGCTALTEIAFTEGASVSFGNYAFNGCTSLTAVTIPEEVTSTGNYMFSGCSALKSVQIESTETTLGSYLFYNCTSLTDVTLPEGITSLKTHMFDGCTALSAFTIPDTVTTTGTYVFKGCTALENAVLSDAMTSVSGYLFYGCTALTDVELPENVKTISSYAFYGCTSLASVTFPETLTSLGNYAFDGCTALTDVYYVGTADTWSSKVTVNTGNDVISDAQFHYIINLSSADIMLSDTAYTYDGTAHEPSVTVTYDGTALIEDTDYTVTYTDNVNAGTATAAVTGAGDCIGTAEASFTISPASIAEAETTLAETAYTYDGTAKEPAVSSVTLNGTLLTADTDYTVSYSSNTNAGTAQVIVTGTGNYTDSASAEFTIEAASLSDAEVTLSYTTATYSGSAHTPDVTVILAGTTLAAGTDYTVSYADNTDAGTAAVTVTGTGNYTGTAAAEFTIEAASIADASAVLSDTTLEYTGSALEPSVTLTWNDTALTSGTDYTVSYSNNTQVGTATAAVTGVGNFTGTLTLTFEITECAHVGGSETVITAPTCTTSGESSYVCTKCGETYTAETAALGHSYTAEITAPTCTESGYTTYTCETCGDTYTAEETAATGHTAADAVQENVAAATCTATGSYESVVYCADCGEELSRETITIAAAGHTAADAVQENVVSATCTAAGSYDTVVYCSVCGEELSRTTTSVAKLAHSYTSKITTAATCTTAGVRTYTCSSCGDTYTETIAATGHSSAAAVRENAVSATCTAAGSYDTVVYCSTCGEELSRTTTSVAKLAHSYTSKITTAATCMTAGVRTYTCSVCKNTYTTSIAKLGHSYSNNICTRCGALKTSTVTSASVTLSSTSYTYNGSAKTPSVTVKVNGTTLTKGTDFTVTYKNNKKAGTATVTVTGIGKYSGTIAKTFTIKKASQSLTVKKSTKTVKYASVKKKKQTVKAITKVSGAKGTVTYKKISGSAKFTVNSKTGKITVKKGTKKGTYKIKIKVTSAKTANYKAASKTVTVTIKVK